jgi:Family of unknown function (DUF5947)
MAANSFQTLRNFTRRPAPKERCEICGAELPGHHPHLIEPKSRRLMCACQACSVLFSSEGAKFKRIPGRVRFLREFRITDAQWDGLMIPINLAFFFKSGLDGGVMAFYPSPAGPTESLLALEAWEEIARENPVLNDMAPDVEALLVNRTGAEYYLLPIDKCYELVGLIRTNWRGLSGGSDVWTEIARFFAGLKREACLI